MSSTSTNEQIEYTDYIAKMKTLTLSDKITLLTDFSNLTLTSNVMVYFVVFLLVFFISYNLINACALCKLKKNKVKYMNRLKIEIIQIYNPFKDMSFYPDDKQVNYNNDTINEENRFSDTNNEYIENLDRVNNYQTFDKKGNPNVNIIEKHKKIFYKPETNDFFNKPFFNQDRIAPKKDPNKDLWAKGAIIKGKRKNNDMMLNMNEMNEIDSKVKTNSNFDVIMNNYMTTSSNKGMLKSSKKYQKDNDSKADSKIIETTDFYTTDNEVVKDSKKQRPYIKSKFHEEENNSDVLKLVGMMKSNTRDKSGNKLSEKEIELNAIDSRNKLISSTIITPVNQSNTNVLNVQPKISKNVKFITNFVKEEHSDNEVNNDNLNESSSKDSISEGFNSSRTNNKTSKNKESSEKIHSKSISKSSIIEVEEVEEEESEENDDKSKNESFTNTNNDNQVSHSISKLQSDKSSKNNIVSINDNNKNSFLNVNDPQEQQIITSRKKNTNKRNKKLDIERDVKSQYFDPQIIEEYNYKKNRGIETSFENKAIKKINKKIAEVKKSLSDKAYLVYDLKENEPTLEERRYLEMLEEKKKKLIEEQEAANALKREQERQEKLKREIKEQLKEEKRLKELAEEEELKIKMKKEMIRDMELVKIAENTPVQNTLPPGILKLIDEDSDADYKNRNPFMKEFESYVMNYYGYYKHLKDSPLTEKFMKKRNRRLKQYFARNTLSKWHYFKQSLKFRCILRNMCCRTSIMNPFYKRTTSLLVYFGFIMLAISAFLIMFPYYAIIFDSNILNVAYNIMDILMIFAFALFIPIFTSFLIYIVNCCFRLDKQTLWWMMQFIVDDNNMELEKTL